MKKYAPYVLTLSVVWLFSTRRRQIKFHGERKTKQNKRQCVINSKLNLVKILYNYWYVLFPCRRPDNDDVPPEVNSRTVAEAEAEAAAI